MSYTGRIEIEAVALDAIHHGAGTEGNTQVLRRQETLRPDGTIDSVPFISGNSIRHMLRNAGVLFALEAMAVEPESLSKAVIDLLFSGGSLGGKNSMTLAKAKAVEAMFPVLSLLGYSAGNTIASGRIEVWNLHLRCEQNIFRSLSRVDTSDPRWQLDGNAQTGSQFGTRHDAARIAHAARFLALPDAERGIVEASAPKGKTKAPKGEETTQMIYDYETILPGAEFFGGIVYRGLKEQELDALVSALSYACDGADGSGYLYRVGAKSGTGLGRMRWHFTGLQRPVTPSAMSESTLLPVLSGGGSERLEAYKVRLHEHRAAILSSLEELAA